MPENLDRMRFLESFLGEPLIVCHDLLNKDTLLLTELEVDTKVTCRALPGIEFSEAQREARFGDALCLIAADSRGEENVFDSMYTLFGGLDAEIFVSFTPMNRKDVLRAERKTEIMLSKKETGFTKSVSTRGEAASLTDARHTEAYYGSDEKELLASLLEAQKSAMLANGNAYAVVIFLVGDYGLVRDYLYSKLPVIESRKVNCTTPIQIYKLSQRIEALPFDSSRASKMVGFSTSIRRTVIVDAHARKFFGDIALGNSVEGSLMETDESVGVSASAFNLGTIVSGVPGTGKTFAAMGIVGQIAKRGKALVAIISPTEEWNAFGYNNGMRVLRLQRQRTGINFFKCDSGIEIGRFSENLAMLMASASDAGPYTGSLEKCLVAAFRQVYSREIDPDPVSVYEAIEEAIVEQHGKRAGTGVKYTKHGENTRAALQNLRSMLNVPEFSRKEGVDLKELLKAGVVFDLSAVSNKMKPFYYALLLNQIYGIADCFDTRGDSELRMLICLEEAQLVFRKENDTAAAQDLVQRIQDFRKKGVGLMLITHNITDIEPSIRRICQTKLYFRQSADVAKFATADLLFSEESKDAVAERMKGMERGLCAVTYLQGRERAAAAFLKTPRLAPTELSYEPEDSYAAEPREDMVACVTDGQGGGKEGIWIQIFYVGEKVYDGRTGTDGKIRVRNTIRGNKYVLVARGDRKKDSRMFNIVGGELNIVKI
ncbi:MAG: hypothetical protein M1286_03025 [Candidatus Marsarchaeota archaeon]|nr:hypothetical protein [Candidatus Marsarchaeota archaeon]